jgi:enoyl-CoA hydratase
MKAIYESPVPVVAAVQGPAIGGGLAYASLCDFIVATPKATFSAPEIDRGLLGASAHVARLLGPYRARQVYLLGKTISAEELLELGVICEIVSPEQLLQVARSYALRLAAKSPAAMRLAKEAMVRTEYLPVLEAYRIEQDYTNRLRSHPDAGEAQEAWAERRPPRWLWDVEE